MLITIVRQLSSIVVGTSRIVQVTVVDADGNTLDISADTMTLVVKDNPSDADVDALINEDADVGAAGASGIAIFALTPAVTTIPVGKHYYDIILYRGTDEFVVSIGRWRFLERVSDV